MRRIGFALAAVGLGLVVSGPAAADLKAVEAALAANDYRKALAAARPLAEQGNPKAAFTVGLLTLNGKGTQQSAAEAYRWFRRAAADGHADAQLYLGRLAMTGQGTGLDFVEAYVWFTLAVENGSEPARAMQASIGRQLTAAQRKNADWRLAQWRSRRK